MMQLQPTPTSILIRSIEVIPIMTSDQPIMKGARDNQRIRTTCRSIFLPAILLILLIQLHWFPIPIHSQPTGIIAPETAVNCTADQCTGQVSPNAWGVSLGTCGCVNVGASCSQGCHDGWTTTVSTPRTCSRIAAQPEPLFLGGAQRCIRIVSSSSSSTGTSINVLSTALSSTSSSSSSTISSSSTNHPSTSPSSLDDTGPSTGRSSTAASSSTGFDSSSTIASSTGSLSSTGTSGETSSSSTTPVASSSSSTGVTISSLLAANVNLTTSYSWSTMIQNPDAFQTQLLQDLQTALGLPASRIQQVHETEQSNQPSSVVILSFLIIPSTNQSEPEVMSFVTELQQQLQQSTSLLHSGVITATIQSMTFQMKEPCADHSYTTPCPGIDGVESTDNESAKNMIYISLGIVLPLLILILVCLAFVIYRRRLGSSSTGTSSSTTSNKIASKTKSNRRSLRQQYGQVGMGEDEEDQSSLAPPSQFVITTEDIDEELGGGGGGGGDHELEMAHVNDFNSSMSDEPAIIDDYGSSSRSELPRTAMAQDRDEDAVDAFTSNADDEPELIEWHS